MTFFSPYYSVDSVNCVRGFMGFERIRYLLEPSETQPSVTAKNDTRQQITHQ